MNVYIIQVIPKKSPGRVSQEGYTSLKKAQAFIEGRSDHPKQVSPYLYKTAEETLYLIYKVTVV